MTTQAGNNPADFEICFSKRARRIRITVLPGRVKVTSPVGIPRKLVEAFVRSRAEWIKEKLDLFSRHRGPTSVIQMFSGGNLWLFGEELTLRIKKDSQVPFQVEGELVVGEEWLSGNMLRNWLDEILFERIHHVAAEFTLSSSLSPLGIRLGNARTRWGSCSPRGMVMINRKLVHAPLSIVEYITLHELMHLRHRNHSHDFWKDLSSVFHGVSEAKYWLRFQGSHLL